MSILNVSIIMPCYNAAKYIENAISSVFYQTYKNWELIIVDDKSTDNSVEIVEKYINEDPRVRLVKLDLNGGASNAKNVALKYATGRYIAFLDSDDVWLPLKLEKQIEFMRSRDLVLTYSSYYIMDKFGCVHSICLAQEEISYKKMLKSNFIGNLTAIYDCRALGKYFFSGKGHEDYIVWLQIMKKIERTFGILEPLAKYRRTSDSLSGNKLRAASWQFCIYREVANLPLFSSIYYFCNYIYFALKKYKKVNRD